MIPTIISLRKHLINGLQSFGLLAGLMLFPPLLLVSEVFANEAPDSGESYQSVEVDDPSLDLTKPLRDAWQQARGESKLVMLVLGADWCDRCALLKRYMEDTEMNQRIDERFVVLNLNVGKPDSFIQMEDNSMQLPVIVMLDSDTEFNQLMTSDNLLTFLADPNQPIYDWLENVLYYSDQTVASY